MLWSSMSHHVASYVCSVCPWQLYILQYEHDKTLYPDTSFIIKKISNGHTWELLLWLLFKHLNTRTTLLIYLCKECTTQVTLFTSIWNIHAFQIYSELWFWILHHPRCATSISNSSHVHSEVSFHSTMSLKYGLTAKELKVVIRAIFYVNYNCSLLGYDAM